ncbi:MAG: hypothetical protein BWX80_02194 [Candidatus Hydrogenedentes bacterium ADurb.Bin101]|nr:MAG: hypothetical protein BWX80_02194 [Candidatus Hydrogenedentes bacterium ADurb.Bin101]
MPSCDFQYGPNVLHGCLQESRRIGIGPARRHAEQGLTLVVKGRAQEQFLHPARFRQVQADSTFAIVEFFLHCKGGGGHDDTVRFRVHPFGEGFAHGKRATSDTHLVFIPAVDFNPAHGVVFQGFLREFRQGIGHLLHSAQTRRQFHNLHLYG